MNANSVNNTTTIQYQQQETTLNHQHPLNNKLQTQDRSCQLLLMTTTTTAATNHKNNHINSKNSDQMSSPLPVIKPSELLLNPTMNNERSLVAVYCFIKNFIG